jgi:hypothetical protein
LFLEAEMTHHVVVHLPKNPTLFIGEARLLRVIRSTIEEATGIDTQVRISEKCSTAVNVNFFDFHLDVDTLRLMFDDVGSAVRRFFENYFFEMNVEINLNWYSGSITDST